MMDSYYFIFHNMTQAQTAASVLRRYGVSAMFLRTPKVISHSGCGYALRVRPQEFQSAVSVARENNTFPLRIFRLLNESYAEEVFL